jgi:hypothetical protein
MTENVFQVFMAKHAPIGALVEQAEEALWQRSALAPAVKEELRIAAAEAVGCSYCTRFRTEGGEGRIIDEELDPVDRDKAELAKRFVTAMVHGEETDELVQEAEAALDEDEFTDLVFSSGWFIGMQHVGRLMHWDEACPVAPIRAMVESGQAA